MVVARGALVIGLAAAFFVAFVAIAATSDSGNEQAVSLIADCAVNPSASGCHRPSFLDMINGINKRAQGNAIRQKKVREQLLKEESRRRLHDKAASSHKEEDLKSTKYNGLDIASKDAIHSEMKELMKTGGKAAVAAKVAEIRQHILTDSGKLFHFGKKAGFLPPPEALKRLK